MIVPLVFFTAGLTLASASGVAVAQAPPLGTLDTNRDGSVSRIEATALPSLDAQFTLLDENQNGALEPAEFARYEELDRESTPPLGTTPRRGTPFPPPDGSTPPPVPR
jgi:hypothetical protein